MIRLGGWVAEVVSKVAGICGATLWCRCYLIASVGWLGVFGL